MDFIMLIKKIILGIIQGISEVLPISSSGHLTIFSNILNVETDGLHFMILLHFGSLVAMLIYYWKDVFQIIVSLFKFLFQKDRTEETIYYCRLFINLIIASIPAAIIGIAFEDVIGSYLSNLYFVFSFLIVTGTVLLISKNLNGTKTLKEMKAGQAFGIGCFQACGVLPGISRSGSTICGGKILKLKQEDAAHFSFLMFLIVSGGSFLLDMIKNYDLVFNAPLPVLATDSLAVIISGITTYLAVKYIFIVIKKGKLHYFAYYCFLVAIIGIITCLCIGYGF